MPSGFSLEQNFPNPFNPVTTIRFSLIQSGFVSLKIYDVIGKEIATLINGDMNRGNHSIQWNTASLPSGVSSKGGYASGVYFYRLLNGYSSETRKMLLTK